MGSALWDFFVNGSDSSSEKHEVEELEKKADKTASDKDKINQLKDRINDDWKGRYI
jgi:hypothetical protein